MRPALFLAALVASVSAAAAPAFASGAAAPAAGAPSAAALKLAERLEELTEPRTAMVAVNIAGFETTLRRTLTLRPDIAKLEVAYPGLTDAVIAAVRPDARSFSEKFVERAAAIRRDAYVGALSERELAEVVAFFESPPAQRAVHALLASLDLNPVADEVAKQAVNEGKIGVTAEQARQAEHSAALKVSRLISAEDEVAFLRFGQTEAGKKYMAARNGSSQALLELANRPDPVETQKQAQTIQAAMLAYIDRKKGH